MGKTGKEIVCRRLLSVAEVLQRERYQKGFGRVPCKGKQRYRAHLGPCGFVPCAKGEVISDGVVDVRHGRRVWSQVLREASLTPCECHPGLGLLKLEEMYWQFAREK